MADADRYETVAGVDLGSNSFHLVVARNTAAGGLQIVDRLREQVQLAAGLDTGERLSPDAEARALDCLRRFGERLRDVSAGRVRAVGTSALRRARNAREFTTRASAALGHAVEVISGHEEARLIYVGVAASAGGDPDEPRLVVDIGGGSTECIVGAGFAPRLMESLHLGCIVYSQRHFPQGAITRENMTRAEIAAMQELQSVQRAVAESGWRRAMGASGTIHAVEDILRAQGGYDGAITAPGLKALRRSLLDAGHVSRLQLPGTRADRLPILPGGLAILIAVFEMFGVERMETAQGALREGLLYDLSGRLRHEDVRAGTIARLAERCGVDRAQADRVETRALALYDAAAVAWGLDADTRDALAWAARLHEIGLMISHSGYHRHGAYLVANADLDGFSYDEQQLVAALVLAHRRKWPKDGFRDLNPTAARRAVRAALLLRLAVLLNRSRRDTLDVDVRADRRGLTLTFAAEALDTHPLTRADLAEEAKEWQAAGLELTVR